MSPKTVGAYSKFSHLMELLPLLPDIEQLIRADFCVLLADAIDTAAINGSGSSSQPTGILPNVRNWFGCGRNVWTCPNIGPPVGSQKGGGH